MHGHRNLKVALLASATLAAVQLAGQASAQTVSQPQNNGVGPEGGRVSGSASTTSVSDVIVTARRRPESMFDAPVPVTVVSAATLKTFDVTDLKSLIDLVPNAELPKAPDNYTLYINIRGIQQTDVNAAPNFGIYRNGIYSGGERPSAGSLIDVSRVEIDAGPQAGLYGRDAVGGAVNVIYATPEPKFGGYFTAAYGNHQYAELQGAINAPLSDNFAVRATGWYLNQNQGEIYNATLKQYVDRYTRDGGRLTAKFTPNDKLSILWTAEYDNNTGPSIEAYAPNGILNGTVRSAPETPYTIYRDTPDRNWNHQTYLAQDVHYDTGFGQISWLTNYSNYQMHDVEDQDQTNLAPTAGAEVVQTVLHRKESTQDFYTELDWSSPDTYPVTLLAGVSYFNEKFQFGRDFSISSDLSLLPSGFGIPALGVQTADFFAPTDGSSIKTSSVSAFGQLTWKITPRLSVTGGLRYTQDNDALNFLQTSMSDTAGGAYIVYIYADAFGVFPPLKLIHNYTFENLSPNAEINFKYNDHLNLYALYGTGFRAGGFNLTTTSVALIPYGSEEASNYEIGAKTLWFGGRLGMNLSAFYMEQTHLLTYNPDPNPAAAALGFYYLNNVGAAGTYGIEYTATARVTDWWSAALSVGWLDAKITKGVSYGESEAGMPLENTRTWTLNARSNIDYPLTDGYRLIGGVNFQMDAGGYLDLTNIPWKTEDRLDLVFGVGKGNTTLVLYGDNVLNSRPPDFVYGNGATTLVQGDTYGIRVSTKF